MIIVIIDLMKILQCKYVNHMISVNLNMMNTMKNIKQSLKLMINFMKLCPNKTFNSVNCIIILQGHF